MGLAQVDTKNLRLISYRQLSCSYVVMVSDNRDLKSSRMIFTTGTLSWIRVFIVSPSPLLFTNLTFHIPILEFCESEKTCCVSVEIVLMIF